MARRNCATRDSERCGYADTRQTTRAFRPKPVEIASTKATLTSSSLRHAVAYRVQQGGFAFAALNSAQHVGASLGTAVLRGIAAATTRTMLSASAPSAEALVHGYASAAGLEVTGLAGLRGGRDLDSHPN